MAHLLLNKAINDKVKLELLIKWLLDPNPQEQYVEAFDDCRCSLTDFLTYFLNFVHEEIPCQNRCGDTLQKTGISKRTESTGNEETLAKKKPTLSSDTEKTDINKSASYPLSLNKSLKQDDASQSCGVIVSHSTPKILRIQSENHLTNGHISPVSPLYRTENHFSTPNTKKQNSVVHKSMEKASPLRLGDFIINKRTSTKKKISRNILTDELIDESSKRITPTNLSQITVNNSFRRNENSFNSFKNTKEVSKENLNANRIFLAEERLKILSRKNSGDNLVAAGSKKINNLGNLKAEIEPDISCVVNKKQLDYLIEIYVCIMRNNFVLNISSEMYFLISLLLSKQFSFNWSNDSASIYSSDDSQMGVDFLNEDDKCKNTGENICSADLFETVHNIVYFAAKCLESQIDILKHYDKVTLKLLSRNKRLRMFTNSFADKLDKICENKSEGTLEFVDNDLQTNVCFNLDTDNRQNFPNDSTFHSFRKQRDLFYEILRVWENNHLLPGWDFAVGLGGKIRSLFSLQSDPANFMHFSRLFKAQLLGTCGTTQKEEGLLENQLPFLSSLPNVDTDKLNRLNNRLVTKQSSNGINYLPAFIGYQEFYKDFIVIAANYAFNKHLCDTLTAEIVELNDMKFSCTDLDESGVSIDPSTHKAYIVCLKSLRILAKFVGFVESLPYKSHSGAYTDHQLNVHLNVRVQVVPSFDIKHLLVTSVKQNSLILTVPWITEYISMLDYVTVRLPYYISVCKMLFDVYKNIETRALANKSPYNYSVSLIKFCLGWLFEQPHFPDSEYFNFCMSTSRCHIETVSYAQKTRKTKAKETKARAMDDLAIVDQNVLYMCCPYLEEIKKLLSSNALNNTATVKHITPVTAAQSSNEITKKRLEQQLEEAFFNGQPVSVRKTVEFVSERIASTCVKHICNSTVPTFKKAALGELRSFIVTWKAEYTVLSPIKGKSHKASLKTKVSQMSQDNLKSLRDNCEREITKVTKEKIPTAIDSLLAIDVLPQMKGACVAVAMKMCIERVKQWINSHVTLSVFTKDFDSEVQRALSSENSKKIVKDKPTFILPPGGNGKEHNDAATSAFHLLEKMKCLSVDILENSANVTEDTVINVLEQSYTTLTERCDVNECVVSYTCMHLVDFSLLLIAHRPKIMTKSEILTGLIKVWKCNCGRTDDLFKNLLCQRNTMLLAQANNEVFAWEVLANFVAFLIKKKMLSCDDFTAQCTSFFKKDWDKGSLKNFTTFLHKFVECYIHNGGSPDKFTFLLEFLSDFCSDI